MPPLVPRPISVAKTEGDDTASAEAAPDKPDETVHSPKRDPTEPPVELEKEIAVGADRTRSARP